MKTEKIHISRIMVGDTIFHDNKEMTVCKNNLKQGFCGLTVFGDSYKMGTAPVMRIL